MRYLVYIIMASVMLHWPNMIYGYSSFTSSVLKNLILLSTIGLFAMLGYRKMSQFVSYFLVMGIVAVFYCIVNGYYFHSYVLRTIFFICICGAFYQSPCLLERFIKVGLVISALLGFQAIVLAILMVANIPLSYESVTFVNSGIELDFNWLAGFKNDPNYYRTISYFTETNRLAYFLTPSLFISYYYSKYSQKSKDRRMYKMVFAMIVFAILSTFSVFSFFSIACGVMTFVLFTKKSSRKILLVFPVLALIGYGVYLSKPEYFEFMFNKSGSITHRILGIITKVELVQKNPYGYDEKTLAAMYSGKDAAEKVGGSTLTLLHWAITAGMQSVYMLLILLMMWVANLLRLLKSNDKFLVFLACGMTSNLLQQSFYGSYYEYYFLAMMAVVTVYAKFLKKDNKIKKRQKKKQRLANAVS